MAGAHRGPPATGRDEVVTAALHTGGVSSPIPARRALGSLAAAALAMVAVLHGPTVVSAEEPDLSRIGDTGLRHAAQVASPSIVEVDLEIDGTLRGSSGTRAHQQLGFAGTGFFVSSDGYIVTAAHVAAPTADEIHQALVDDQVDKDHNCNRTTTDACADIEAQYSPALMSTTEAVDVSTSVRVITQEMTADDPGLVADVVTSSPGNERDVAVLKVNLQDAPVLLVAAHNPPLGTAMAVEGYPESQQTAQVPVVTVGTVRELRPGDPGFAATATVVGTDARIEHGNSGGPGIDPAGEAVGIVSYGPSTDRNYLVSAQDVDAVMAQTPAQNRIGTIDQLWRDGLTALARGDTASARDLFQRCADLNSVQVSCRDEADRLAGQPTLPAQPRPAGSVVADSAISQDRALVDGILIGIVMGSGGTLLVTAVLRRRALRRARLQAPGPPWWGAPPPGWGQHQAYGQWWQPPVAQSWQQPPPPPPPPVEDPPAEPAG